MTTPPIAELDRRPMHEREHGQAVRSMFDRIAPTYDALNRLMSAGVDRRWRKQAVALLRRAPAGPVLDLCAGTMDLTALVARARPNDRVIATDFAAEMLERGRHKAPRAERVVADALDLPFESASVAAVVCGFGVRNLADPALGAREVRRVLRPGGVFVVLEFFRPERAVTRAFHAIYAERVLPAVGGLFSGDRAAYRYLADSMGAFLSRAEYEAVLRDAGFVNVRGQDLTLGVAGLVRAEAPSSVEHHPEAR